MKLKIHDPPEIAIKEYPDWICKPCGDMYGRKPVEIATWHVGVCEVCQSLLPVTEPRDFGHLNLGWQLHNKAKTE